MREHRVERHAGVVLLGGSLLANGFLLLGLLAAVRGGAATRPVSRPAPVPRRAMLSPTTEGRHGRRLAALLAVTLVLAPLAPPLLQAAPLAVTGTCNGNTVSLPFTDVPPGGFFCVIFEALALGITAGTSPTTYTPTANVTRDQMAAFTSRALEAAVHRSSQRNVLKRWYLPDYSGVNVPVPATTIGGTIGSVETDGEDVWVSDQNVAAGRVLRVHGSDGVVTGIWTGMNGAYSMVAAYNGILVATSTSPGKVYFVDPSTYPTNTTGVLVATVGNGPAGIAFDGARIWVTNATGNSISIITPQLTLPNPVTTIGGFSSPVGVVADGTAVWITERSANRLSRLAPDATRTHSATVGTAPQYPVFDGVHLWVPNGNDNSISVVRAIGNSTVPTGTVVTTLGGNGLLSPMAAAFDGERVLVTNGSGAAVSLWRAADLAPLGAFGVGGSQAGATSDGRNFWVTQPPTAKIVRY